MADGNDRVDPGFRRSIRKVRERAFMAQLRVREQQVAHGFVSEDARRELAGATLALRDRLLTFREDSALTQDWSDYGVDWVETLAGETVRRPEPTPRSNGNHQTVERPALLYVEPERLMATVRQLDQIARDLGFEAATKDRTPNDKGDLEDLRSLLETRGQTEAAERVPASGGES